MIKESIQEIPMSAETITRNVEYLVDGRGRRKKAVLPIEEYEELLADLEALAVIASRVDEGYISTDELKIRLYGSTEVPRHS